MTEPQTAAGKVLRRYIVAAGGGGDRSLTRGELDIVDFRLAAIEAEAREPLAAEIVRLRAALTEIAEWDGPRLYAGDAMAMMIRAHAALSADAGETAT